MSLKDLGRIKLLGLLILGFLILLITGTHQKHLHLRKLMAAQENLQCVN